MNELAEYVRPVPAVVVAYEETVPLYTANIPEDRDGRFRVPKYPKVEEAYVDENRVEEALVNVFRALHTLAVVVPKARENVRSEERSPPPSIGYVVFRFLVVGTYDPAA